MSKSNHIIKMSAGRIQLREEKKRWAILTELLQYGFFLCGICGSLTGFTEIAGIQYREKHLMWVLAVLGLYLWWAFGRGKSRLVLAYLPSAAVYWLCRDVLKKEGAAVIYAVIRQAEEIAGGPESGAMLTAPDSGGIRYATLFTGLIMLAVMLVLLELTRVHRWFLPAFLFLTLPVLAGILLERPPSFVTVCLLTLFFTGSLSAGVFRKRKTFGAYCRQACFLNGLMTGFFVLSVSCLVYAGTEQEMDGMMNRANGWGRQILRRVTGSADTRMNKKHTGKAGNTTGWLWQNDGWVNQGDQAGGSTDPRIRTWLPKKPEQLVYLKGFTGMEYTGRRWEEAYLSPEEQEQEERLYHLLEAADQDNGTGLIKQMKVKEYQEEGKHRPYFSGFMDREDTGYRYSYYTLRDAGMLLPERSAEQAGGDVYPNEILTKYMDVPVNDLPRLAQLCRSNPFQTPEEVTAFIKGELARRASYTLTPGMDIDQEDIVEYFLFEGKKGYCIHFATTAVLMYRMYGIPARYVTGYLAQPGDFAEASDGTYEAVLTDDQAHAWVEIYDLTAGWIPVEVTPGQSVVTEEDLRPELEGSEVQDTPETSEPEAEPEEPEKEKPKEPEADTVPLPITGVHDEGKTGTQPDAQISLWLGAAFLAVGAAGSVLLLFIRRRKKLLRRHAEAGSGAVFEQMMEVLHDCGCLTGMCGQEEEFADRFAGETGVLAVDEVKVLLAVVQRAAFGKEAPPPAKERWAVKNCRRVMMVKGGGLPALLRWKYRIWKGYF